MADVTKTVEIIFGAIDKTSGGISSVNSGLGKLSGSVESISAPLANATDLILKVDTALIILAATMTGVAIKAASDFQQEFGEITTLFTASSENVEAFSDDILSFASKSTQSLSQINSATYAAISAGAAYEDSLALVSEAERLAVAGKADLDSTTIALVSTLNAYGESTDSAARFSDILFTTVKEGQTTIPELATKLSLVTSIAAASGVSFEEVAASLATLTAGGQPTSLAMTSLKGVINALISPSKESKEAFDALGIEIGASAIQSKGFSTIINEITEAVDGDTDALKALFPSLEAFSGAAVLAGTNNDKFNSSLEATINSAGATEVAFEKMKENLTLSTQALFNNINVSFVSFGTELLPQFSKDVSSLSDVFKAVTFSINETDTFKPILDSLNSFGLDIETLLSGVAESLPEALNNVDFTGMLESIGFASDSLASVFGDLDFTDAEDLTKAVQFVIDSLESLALVSEGIFNKLAPFVSDVIIPWVDAFNKLDDETKLASGELLGLGKIVDEILPLFNSLLGIVEGVSIALGLLASKGMADTVLGMINMGSEAKAVTSLLGSFSGALKLAGGIAAAGAAGWAAGSFISDTWGDEISEATEGLFDFADSILDFTGTQGSFERTVDGLVSKFAELGVEIDGSRVTTENLERYWLAYGTALREATNENESAGNSISTLSDEMIELAKSNEDLQYATGDFGYAVEGVDEVLNKLTETTDKAIKTNDGLAESQKDTVKDLEVSKEKLLDFDLAMSKLSTEIYVAELEFDASIAIGEMEKFKTSVSSLGDTITGSQTLLSSLVGSLDMDKLGPVAFYDVLKIIKEEAELKKEQMELQNKLIEAELANIHLKNEYLSRDDAGVTISAEGLEPEIEAFMFKILERIQLRASEEQAAFLLGVT